MKLAIVHALWVSHAAAFTSPGLGWTRVTSTSLNADVTSDVEIEKKTGVSFLPEDIVELAKKGNPTEKAKIARDPVNAWTDIYDFAKKIRAGELNWEDIEKADMNIVSDTVETTIVKVFVSTDIFLSFQTEIQVRRFATPRQAHTGTVHDAP